MGVSELSESMQITLDSEAPSFETEDIFDRKINLADYKNKKVFIGFFRHAGCPFCNLRIRLLQKLREELLENNMEMIFFFESTKETLLDSKFHKKASPIPIISDPEKKYYQLYGVQESGIKSAVSHLTSFIGAAIKAKIHNLPLHKMKDGESIKTVPAEFLLDENLQLKKLHYSDGLNDRMEVEDILDFAQGK